MTAMLALRTTPVVGLPQFDGWSQVATDQRHTWVCAYAVVGDNAGNVGREVADLLSSSQPTSAFQVHQLLSSIIQSVDLKGCDIQMVLLLVAQGKSVIGAYQGGVLLKRGTKVGTILQTEELQIIEGTVKEEDVFVLVTDQGETFMGEVQQKLIQGYDVDTIVTSVVPGVHSSTSSAKTAIAFAEVIDREDIPETEEDMIGGEDTSATATFARDLSKGVSDSEQEPRQPGPSAQGSDDAQQRGVEEINLDAGSGSVGSGSAKLRSIDAETDAEFTTGPDSKNDTASATADADTGSAASRLNTEKSIKGIKISPWVVGAVTLFLLGLKAIAIFTWKHLKSLGPLIVKHVQRLRGKEVYLEDNQPSRTSLIIGSVILVVFLVIIGGAIWQMRQRGQVRSQAQGQVQTLLDELSAAEAMANEDTIQARETTSYVLSELESLAQQYQDQPAGLRVIEDAQERANTLYQQISGQEEVSELPLFYDLRLIETDFISSAVASDGETAYFLDAERKVVVSLNLNSKQVEKVDPAEWNTAKDIALADDGDLWVLADGLYQSERLQDFARRRDGEEQLDTAVSVSTFGSNLYVLNPERRSIYRYAPEEESDGLSDPVSWLQDSLPSDWGAVSDLTIDGDIWLATDNGEIFKLSSRSFDQQLEVEGMPEPLSSQIKIRTTVDGDQLYILEPDAYRIVVLSKEGQFIKEVKNDQIGGVTDFFVNADGDLAFLVSGSLVYTIEL